MSSQLVAIFQALAAMSVTVQDSIAYNGDKTPEVLLLDTLPSTSPAAAKLPKRLLRMMRASDGGAKAFEIVFGNENIARVPWRIYDVLLWREIQAGAGVGSHEADLIKYAAAYVDALQLFIVTLGTTLRSQLVGVTMTVDAINYPEGGTSWFAAVEVALDIEERLISTTPANWS